MSFISPSQDEAEIFDCPACLDAMQNAYAAVYCAGCAACEVRSVSHAPAELRSGYYLGIRDEEQRNAFMEAVAHEYRRRKVLVAKREQSETRANAAGARPVAARARTRLPRRAAGGGVTVRLLQGDCRGLYAGHRSQPYICHGCARYDFRVAASIGPPICRTADELDWQCAARVVGTPMQDKLRGQKQLWEIAA